MPSRAALAASAATLMMTSACGAPVIPDGWVAISRPSEEEMRCANYERAWVVEVIRGEVRISPREVEPRPRRQRNPFSIDDIQEPGSDPRVDHVVGLVDGWIAGIGGDQSVSGVWWFGRNRDTGPSLLLHGNVMGLLGFRDAVVVLVGLDLPTAGRGGILLASRGVDRQWSVDGVAELGSLPLVSTAESQETLLVLDGEGLRRIHLDSGRVEGLVEVSLGSLHPTSMVVTRSGQVFVGMRHAVARFDLTTHPPSYDWLVNERCPGLRRLNQWECYCVGGTTGEPPG